METRLGAHKFKDKLLKWDVILMGHVCLSTVFDLFKQFSSSWRGGSSIKVFVRLTDVCIHTRYIQYMYILLESRN